MSDLISLHLDPLSKSPLYEQIVEQVEEAIRRKQLQDGSVLWSARKIASHYHISYQTAERALKELARRGLVQRSVARGTVIATNGDGSKPKPTSKHKVIALINCWQVWGSRPTYTMAELEMLQASAHTLSTKLWGMLMTTLGSGDASKKFSVESLAEWCRLGKIDGAIVFGNMPERGLEWLTEQGYAVVVADYEPSLQIPRVVHDNYGGMKLAVNHLIELGHRRIAFIYSLHPYHYGIRRNAYLDTLSENGIEVDPELVVCVRRKGPTVCDALNLWLNMPPDKRPTAIAAGSDILAAKLLQISQEKGIRVPDHFSLTGYDDETFVTMLDPPLTTLRVSWQELGRTAAGMLLNILEGSENASLQDGEMNRVVIPTSLIIRQSTIPFHSDLSEEYGVMIQECKD